MHPNHPKSSCFRVCWCHPPSEAVANILPSIRCRNLQNPPQELGFEGEFGFWHCVNSVGSAKNWSWEILDQLLILHTFSCSMNTTQLFRGKFQDFQQKWGRWDGETVCPVCLCGRKGVSMHPNFVMRSLGPKYQCIYTQGLQISLHILMQ